MDREWHCTGWKSSSLWLGCPFQLSTLWVSLSKQKQNKKNKRNITEINTELYRATCTEQLSNEERETHYSLRQSTNNTEYISCMCVCVWQCACAHTYVFASDDLCANTRTMMRETERGLAHHLVSGCQQGRLWPPHPAGPVLLISDTRTLFWKSAVECWKQYRYQSVRQDTSVCIHFQILIYSFPTQTRWTTKQKAAYN